MLTSYMTATEDHGKTQQGAKDSAPRTLAALAEDLILIPSTYIVAHGHL